MHGGACPAQYKTDRYLTIVRVSSLALVVAAEQSSQRIAQSPRALLESTAWISCPSYHSFIVSLLVILSDRAQRIIEKQSNQLPPAFCVGLGKDALNLRADRPSSALAR